LLALYLLTCRHRILEGLYRLPRSYIAEDLRWVPKRLDEPFAQLLAEGFIDYDEGAGIVLLKKALFYQPTANDNCRKAACRMLATLPRTRLFAGLLECAEQYDKPLAERLREQFPERLGEPLPEPLPERYGEQPQPQPQPQPSNSLVPSGEGTAVLDLVEEVLDLWPAWWLVYPRKDAKVTAEEIYRRLCKKRGVATLLQQAAEHYALACKLVQREKKSIMLPTTFLNKRWVDYVEGISPGDLAYDEWKRQQRQTTANPPPVILEEEPQDLRPLGEVLATAGPLAQRFATGLKAPTTSEED
jgi:hypothetical protein